MLNREEIELNKAVRDSKYHKKAIINFGCFSKQGGSNIVLYIPTTLKKLNFKGSKMSLMEKQAYICKSSKDIVYFWMILDAANEKNEFRDITKIAKKAGTTYKKLAKIVKRGVECGMWKRINKGVYVVNPYVYANSWIGQKKIHELQQEYPKWYVDEKFENWRRGIKLNSKNKKQ